MRHSVVLVTHKSDLSKTGLSINEKNEPAISGTARRIRTTDIDDDRYLFQDTGGQLERFDHYGEHHWG